MIERASAGKSRLWPVGRSARAHRKGGKADLFASTDMGHPLKLAADGLAMRVDVFTRNGLCAFPRPKVGLTLANFLDRLLYPAVRLGTSTPKADPAGDYTGSCFIADGVHTDRSRSLTRKRRRSSEELRKIACRSKAQWSRRCPVICWSNHLISGADQYSPSPIQSRPISTWRFTTSATAGMTCAATSSPPTSPRARRRAVSSKPDGHGQPPHVAGTDLVRAVLHRPCPWSLELFQSAPPQLQ